MFAYCDVLQTSGVGAASGITAHTADACCCLVCCAAPPRLTITIPGLNGPQPAGKGPQRTVVLQVSAGPAQTHLGAA
jgi:hypothetical protein